MRIRLASPRKSARPHDTENAGQLQKLRCMAPKKCRRKRPRKQDSTMNATTHSVEKLAGFSADPNEPPDLPIGPTRLQVQRRSTATRYRVYAPTGFRRHRGQLRRPAPPDPATLDRSLFRVLRCLYQDLSKPRQAVLRGQVPQVWPPGHRQRRTRRRQQPNLPRQAFVKRFRTVKAEKKTGPPRTRTRLSLNQPIAGSGTFKPGVLANRITRWIFPSFVTSPSCDPRRPTRTERGRATPVPAFQENPLHKT